MTSAQPTPSPAKRSGPSGSGRGRLSSSTYRFAAPRVEEIQTPAGESVVYLGTTVYQKAKTSDRSEIISGAPSYTWRTDDFGYLKTGIGPLTSTDLAPFAFRLERWAVNRVEVAVMAINQPDRYGPFQTERCNEPPPELLLQGIAEFNRGEFFEQHETLETLWRGESDPIRYLYQGILLVGVAMYHLRRGNYHGAVSKLTSGRRFLQWFGPVCQGVDVARLMADADRARKEVERIGPDRLGEFNPALVPRVHLNGSA